jgi:hypothetical protein
MEYFIDAYLDIEKDVPQNLQEDIYGFLGLLVKEFDIFLKCPSDLSIFNYYKNLNQKNSLKSAVIGPQIYFEGIFGSYKLRDSFEEFFFESVI